MENSHISWTDHTFNPWMGCTKVSDGCKNCYAEELMDKRYGSVRWGPEGTRKRTSEAYWRKPLAWNRQAEAEGRRYRVFCASLADVFENRPELEEWRRDLVVMMEQTPNLDWLLLTKRPENVTRMIAKTITIDPDIWWQSMRNVWIGTSVENQEQADKRIPHLLSIPARVRFLSMEPLLGPVDLYKWQYGDIAHSFQIRKFYEIHWVIVGGESGPNARQMHPDWVRSIRDQCQADGVAFHFKQWGEWVPGDHPAHGTHWQYVGDDKFAMKRVGKKAAGRLLDGREWSEYPR